MQDQKPYSSAHLSSAVGMRRYILPLRVILLDIEISSRTLPQARLVNPACVLFRPQARPLHAGDDPQPLLCDANSRRCRLQNSAQLPPAVLIQI